MRPRSRLTAANQLSAAHAAALRASQLVTPATAAATAGDEAYWRRVRQFYPMPEFIIHLEHGNWGMMSHTVLAHYEQQLARVNHYTSYYGRRDFGGEEAAIMQQLADWLAVDPAELVLVRNATEALTSLITGYNRLKPGDSVLYADLDYSSMQGLMNSLEERRGVTVRTLAIPEPATHDAILDAYESTLRANPDIRLVLLTHISHRTGLLLPIRELSALGGSTTHRPPVRNSDAGGPCTVRGYHVFPVTWPQRSGQQCRVGQTPAGRTRNLYRTARRHQQRRLYPGDTRTIYQCRRN